MEENVGVVGEEEEEGFVMVLVLSSGLCGFGVILKEYVVVESDVVVVMRKDRMREKM